MKNPVYILAIASLLLLSYGLYQGMVAAPTERTMGDVQRIFYYHVPSAWVAFLLFQTNFLASVLYLVQRNRSTERFAWWTAVIFVPVGLGLVSLIAFGYSQPYAASVGISMVVLSIEYMLIRGLFPGERTDALAVATAEVGVVFCTIVLVTGPLWARPVWGIWWTWDARLTSTLVLWLIYVSYLVLRQFGTGGQTPVLASALAIFGFLDVPLVYMSIRWFRTQHPQPVIGGGEGSGIHPAMREALIWNFAAFLVFAALIVFLRYRLEVAEREVETIYAERAVSPAEVRRNA